MRYVLGWFLIAVPVVAILAGMVADNGLGRAAILLAISLLLGGMLVAGIILITT